LEYCGAKGQGLRQPSFGDNNDKKAALTPRSSRLSKRPPRALKRAVAVLSLGGAVTLLFANATQDAVANGGTRTLTIFHAHTKEQETVTFKSFGSYDSAGLQKLNWILRDWRADEPTRMDPRLFDILWEAQRASGHSGPIHVVSAYRSPGTNAMLARRSRGVAKNSQHMSGRAMDFNMPGVSMATVRDVGLRMQAGGVGYYPRANNPWVHLDTGGVRHWPKVSREHLVRLFPDERTVHIPSDGKPLAGFETARAVIEARGGSVSSGYIDIAEGRATGKTLWQILFGGGEGDDEGDVVANNGRGKKGRTAVAARSRNTQVAALPDAGDGNTMAFFNQPNATTTVAARQEAPALRNARPTRPTPLPEPAKEEPKPAAPPPEVKREEPKPAVEPPKAPEQKPVEVAALQPRAGQVPLTTRTDADPTAEGKRVTVQLPPRKPANFAAFVASASGPTLVTVQLPPQRPATLVASLAPEPPRQPEAAAVGLRTEQPPAAASAFAATQPIPAAGRIIPAAPALQPAQPLPPKPVVAAAPKPAPLPPEGKDRKALDQLMSQVATASDATKVAPVSMPSVSAVTSVRTMTGRFEPAPAAERKEAGGFTGSVVRPIGQGFR
jgi:uncharacterized protein YcbK (DUF882 family)